MKNVVFDISQTISVSLSKEEILTQLESVLQDIPNVYSYLVYANYTESDLTSWTIKYSINEIQKYNTLSNTTVIAEIYELLNRDKKTVKRVIGYNQPSFEIMLELYSPLIKTLARQQCTEWPDLEYEDAISICQLTMLKLYRKGYYLHKYLLEKSFKNTILVSLRHNKNMPEILSLDDIMYNSDNNSPLSLADMLVDNQFDLEREEQEHTEDVLYMFNKVKDFIVDLIGERQFEQLYRDYANKHTTPWSRKTMQKIKHALERQKLNKESFGGNDVI